jgi:hypothetical protein
MYNTYAGKTRHLGTSDSAIALACLPACLSGMYGGIKVNWWQESVCGDLFEELVPEPSPTPPKCPEKCPVAWSLSIVSIRCRPFAVFVAVASLRKAVVIDG